MAHSVILENSHDSVCCVLSSNLFWTLVHTFRNVCGHVSWDHTQNLSILNSCPNFSFCLRASPHFRGASPFFLMARMVQRSRFLVDREVALCVPTTWWLSTVVSTINHLCVANLRTNKRLYNGKKMFEI